MNLRLVTVVIFSKVTSEDNFCFPTAPYILSCLSPHAVCMLFLVTVRKVTILITIIIFVLNKQGCLKENNLPSVVSISSKLHLLFIFCEVPSILQSCKDAPR